MTEASRQLEAPPARRPFVIENLEPTDFLPRVMLPNMVDEHLARYDYVGKFMQDRFPDLMCQKLNILDLASARGYGSANLKKQFSNATVTGIEFRNKYVEKAQKKYGKGDGLKFLQGDVRQTPIIDNSMDVVTAFEIIEHLPKRDQELFMEEIKRVLKPGGIAFVSFPHRYSFEVNKKTKETKRVSGGGNPYHLYEPLPNEVDKYVSDAKLEIAGKFGQILVSEKKADRAKRINKAIPAWWSIFAWGPTLGPKKDVSVTSLMDGKIGITNIYVIKKPSV
jgi:ubiquinone/menaquinone biosynthesis C-methylase UbiE